MLKRLFLALDALLCLAIAALWIASARQPYSRDFTHGVYRYHLESHAGTLSLDAFKDIPEDDFYEQTRLPYWVVEAVFGTIGCILAWWIWRDYRRQQARGFPVLSADPKHP